MAFKEDRSFEKIGKKAGFWFSYLLFTMILYFLLAYLDKIPLSWSYAHIVSITLAITFVGIVIQQSLK